MKGVPQSAQSAQGTSGISLIDAIRGNSSSSSRMIGAAIAEVVSGQEEVRPDYSELDGHIQPHPLTRCR